MLKSITELVVRVTDLIEAEGRHLRNIIARMAHGFAALLVASLLALGGLTFLVFALYTSLRGPLPESVAALITGVITLALAGGVFWIARQQMK